MLCQSAVPSLCRSGRVAGAGFAAVESHDVRAPMRLGGGDLADAVEFTFEIGPVARALREAQAGPELRARVAEAIRDALAAYVEGGAPILPAAAWVFTARSPGA